ncbi:hypothetical protein EX30DRAFT_361619 [Ascodesmis nigricans]|uniref:Uncharacterized protein n=1 Tax=Ascodesmis nigricans TaxID=341454 RepID=A0A4S2N329_9PEZI|nr:hypothetical protein EX30DRAFT_361619 [Ascodesmis nigricans]
MTTSTFSPPTLPPSDNSLSAFDFNDLQLDYTQTSDDHVKPTSRPPSAASSTTTSTSSSSNPNTATNNASISSRTSTYASAAPIPVSSSISAVNVSALTELLQSAKFAPLGLMAKFDIHPVPVSHGVNKFMGTCRVVDRVTRETVHELPEKTGASWPSKKHAKEAAAKRGLEWVSARENLGKRVAELKEREGGDGGKDEEEDKINWVGQVVEYFQKRGVTSYPIYDFFCPSSSTPTANPLFSCTCTFNASLFHPSLPSTLTLGDINLGFPSKKAAKTFAARTVMQYFSSQPCLESSTPIKRPSNTPRSSLALGQKAGNHPLHGQFIMVPRDAKPRKVVSIIQTELKYAIKYDVKQNQEVNLLYTVDVVVDQRWAAKRLKIIVGKTVTGRKRAKEEGAKVVLGWLMKSELPRLGVRLMAERAEGEEGEGGNEEENSQKGEEEVKSEKGGKESGETEEKSEKAEEDA